MNNIIISNKILIKGTNKGSAISIYIEDIDSAHLP